MIERWRQRAGEVKRDIYALYLAMRDPRTPLLAKVVGGVVVAYAVSPIDLIPDFIPVLGYLDDLLLLPLGILLVRRLVPPAILEEHRAAAAARPERPRSLVGAAVVVAIWVAFAAWVVWRFVL
jgi:uncharacterized membrane protein YkvA (DUF1232 family)